MYKRRSLRRSAVRCAVFTVAMSATTAMSGMDVAAAADTVTCRASASVFYALPNTGLDLDHHNEPETGAYSWSGRSGVGYAWDGRVLAGPDGRMYVIQAGGDVLRQRWLGTYWENGGVSQKIASGWYGWTQPAARNRVTVDTLGDFYWSHDNILAVQRYNETTKVWSDRLLDTGWTADKYDLIVGAGAGVFYARTPAGDLYRFQYDWSSQRWIEYATRVSVGGWQNFAQIASPGGDILYGLDKTTGEMKWYRYLGAGTWAPGPKVVGTIGTDYQLNITTDDCKLVNPGQPQRPAVPVRQDAPSAVIEGAGGRLQHFYVDSFGRLIHGRQRADDITIVDFTVVPGYQAYTGTPAALHLSDDSLLATALGQDSETRASTQAPATTSWPAVTGFGGWTPGPAVLAQRSNVGTAFAVDDAGRLWVRPQDPASKQYLPWRVLPSSGLTADLTAVVQSDGIDLVARTTAGTYTKTTYANGALSSWIPVPGTGWTGKLAAVANPDSNLEAFATQPDGTVVNQREQAAGFTGTWKALPGVTAAGAPTAAMDTGGVVHVAVRASDGYVYVTEQVAPASGSYRSWARLTDSRTGASYQSVTDPTLTSLGAGGVVAVFRDSDGVSYAYGTGSVSTSATAMAARTAGSERSAFSGGPLPKPSF